MIVGIDLGTTHCVVAFAEPEGAPTLFAIPQLVSDGREGAPRLLPSFLYAPLAAEGADGPFALRDGESTWLVGTFAQARGAEAAGRLVSSSKSWLSYPRVDRRAPILPWRLAGDPQEDEHLRDVAQISPVTAASLLLRHIQRAWDAAHPDAPLAQQRVVLTVPASFDAVARELTVTAARAVGLDVRLLEEPQAAFYDLMRRGGDAALRHALGDGEEGMVLVCDVGGGTTDLSLVRVSRRAGEVEVERVAVGRHLLLGGDNMDLALAHLCERRLVPEGERLDEVRFAQLVARCRTAKEELLAPDAPDERPIALAGRGSQLVGGTLRTQLTRDEVEQVALEGFFPEVAADEPVKTVTRAGLVAFGLPYERDVAVTRHLAAFLQRHPDERPTALLLNGGVFQAPELAARVAAVVASWTEGACRLLEAPEPLASVALGAAAYGLALAGKGRRITGGSPHSYYLGLRGEGDRGICVLPKGAVEGQPHRSDEHPLAVTVGRKVRFELFAGDDLDVVGALVATGPLERQAPLVTTLADWGTGEREAAVVLEAEVSAIGTLELALVEAQADKPRRFALAFDLRAAEGPATGGHDEASAAARYGQRLDEARAAVEAIFGKTTCKTVPAREVKGLLRKLEKLFGPRASWDATLSRTLFDAVMRHFKRRRTSAEHERMFWMLAGFCLRPGVGHPRDDERVQSLGKLLSQGLAHREEPRSWQQFWIAWRRVAAGLDQAIQTELRDLVDPFLAPAEAGLRPNKAFKNDQRWEMLELGTSLERVAAERRGELGGWIVERTWTERDPRLWAGLGRVGAREPVYGSTHHVVAARTIERWMDHLLRERWAEIPTAPRAAIAMCRVTGDRARDVAPATRDEVHKRLADLGFDEATIRPIHEHVELDDRDRAEIYGEALPVGLTLKA